MTVVTLVSAKGSPGVTTAGLALASAWPHPAVFADVDPVGGDAIWRCRDVSGGPLDPDRGLLALAAAARRGADETTLSAHLQETQLGPRVLVGVPSPEQLSGLGSVWSTISEIFSRHDEDVLVDCGRFVQGSAAVPVVLQSDAVVFVVRPDLDGVAHLRARLEAFKGQLRLGQPDAKPVAVVVATSYRDTRAVDDLQRLLDSEGFAVDVIGILAEDPKGAKLLSSARLGNPRRTLIGRSALSLVERIQAMSGANAVGAR